MDIDDDNDDNEYDIEQELQYVSNETDKIRQLDLLQRELEHIISHNAMPSEGWFDNRIRIMQTYYEMDWLSIARRYHNKDEYIHAASIRIAHILDDLIDECTAMPNFHIPVYNNAIHELHSVLLYCKQIYKREKDDCSNVANLLSNMNLS